jgi:hypothetical protein
VRQLLVPRADFHLVSRADFRLVPHADFHLVPHADFHPVPRADFHPDWDAEFLGVAPLRPLTSTTDRMVGSTHNGNASVKSHTSQCCPNEVIQRTYALDEHSKHAKVKRNPGAPPICQI